MRKIPPSDFAQLIRNVVKMAFKVKERKTPPHSFALLWPVLGKWRKLGIFLGVSRRCSKLPHCILSIFGDLMRNIPPMVLRT